MQEILHTHPAIMAIVAYWIYSAIVGGMPAPTASSSAGYTWAYNSFHILAGNLNAAVAARYPQVLPVQAPTVPVKPSTPETK